MGRQSETAQAARLLPCTREVTGSHLGWDTGYPDMRIIDFLQCLQEKAQDCFEIGHDRFVSLFIVHPVIRLCVV
jgi:hypothetical protein